MNLKEILAEKGMHIFTTNPEATLREVAERLVEKRVGALLVFPRVRTTDGPNTCSESSASATCCGCVQRERRWRRRGWPR